MPYLPQLGIALTVVAAHLVPLPAESHIIVYKTCLAETIEAVSSPKLSFKRRHEARRSGTYSWNALSSDAFGGQYADFTLSNDARALCKSTQAGGFHCVLSGIPCREVESCSDAGSRRCYEVER